MKTFFKLLLFLIMAVCLVFSIHSFITNANNGTNCSTGGIITGQTEQFIIDTFGCACSPEELAKYILHFALKNFTYDEDSISFPQTADINRFIFLHDFHGVCMDFSAFVKSVFQVICRHKGWEHVGCHVVLGHDLRQREGHAVNYITVKMPDGTVKVYEFDVTRDLAIYKKGREPQGIRYFLFAVSQEAVPKIIRKAFSEFYQYPILVVT